MKRLLVFTVLGLFVAASPSVAASGSRLHKLDRALRTAVALAPEPQRVIIRTAPGRQGALRAALGAHGDVVESEHPTLDAMTAYVHGEDLVALANDPAVLSVSCDCEVTTFAAKTNAGAGGKRNGGGTAAPSELRQLLGLDLSANAGYVAKGTGVGVAILDSGLDLSKDFTGRLGGFWDFTKGGGQSTPYDDYGHGTHIAGLIASSGQTSGGQYAGVAPNATLFIFKVLDKRGRGRTSVVIRALEYITANRQQFGIDVVNLSLGHPIMESAATDPLVQAVEAAVRAGLVVVVSAGNNGQNTSTGEIGYAGINSPGNAPSAITSGAADTKTTLFRTDDRVADFSSRGPSWYDGYAKPDVVAPGIALVSNLPSRSTLATQYPELRVGALYGSLSGTSMASAVTAGLVTLVVDQNRHNVGQGYGSAPLTTNAIKAIVEYTATPLYAGEPASDENKYDFLTQGTGEVNGEGAVRLTATIDTSVEVGEYWTIPNLKPFSFFGGMEASWSENIVWGSFLVASDVALYNSAAWDDNIVWGSKFSYDSDENIVWGSAVVLDSFDGGDNIVWGSMDFDRGDNIVWGSADDWADNIVWGNQLLGYADGENIVWGSSDGSDNIVWGSLSEDNIVWGSLLNESSDNIVWGSFDGDNIVWGSGRTGDGDNIVWGNGRTGDGDNIVWGNGRTGDGDNIVWGSGRTGDGDNIVWGSGRTGDGDNIVWGSTSKSSAPVTGSKR
jgi:serine protease AprX